MKKIKQGLFLFILFFSLFSACKKDSKPSKQGSEVETPVSPSTDNPTGETVNPDTTNPETSTSTTTEETSTTKSDEGDNAATSDANSSGMNKERKVVSAKDNMKNYCSAATIDIDTKVLAAAQALTGFEYSSARQSDCSGMFHKMLDKMRESCPQANMPLIGEARSTRGIAKWYHENGNFEIIHDAENKGDLIKPGMVMFFGYGNKLDQYDFPNLTIEKLATRGTGINHVAIVTSVQTKDGKVVSYKMFHGRRPGKPSGITGSDWHPTREGLPAYGNWKEPWIGVANLFAPNKEI